MKPRFIDRFDVILLDMGNTFMFNMDHFSETEDYGATYRQIGGSALSNEELRRIISALYDKALSDYQNPNPDNQFPSLLSYLQTMPGSKDVSRREIKLLEQVFAMHEVGTIPDTHARALRQLHKTHRLGLVSDIWSRSDVYLRAFETRGIHDLFEVAIFSSDYGYIKPAACLFAKAIQAFEVERSRIVFVGDSLTRDILGAKAVGLSAVWINPDGSSKVDENVPDPDLVVQDLRDLMWV